MHHSRFEVDVGQIDLGQGFYLGLNLIGDGVSRVQRQLAIHIDVHVDAHARAD